MTATQYKEIFNELLRVSEESRKLIPLVTEATKTEILLKQWNFKGEWLNFKVVRRDFFLL